MCELAVFINENGTTRRIARSVVRADIKGGSVSLLDSGGKVIRVENTFIVRLDLTENLLVLRKVGKS